jgi:hypothetical protein
MDDDQLALGCKYYIQERLDTIHREKPNFTLKLIKITLIHVYYHEFTPELRLDMTTKAIQNNTQITEKFKKKVQEQQHADIHAPLYDARVINQGYINEYFYEITFNEPSIRLLLESIIRTRPERQREQQRQREVHQEVDQQRRINERDL